MEDKSRVALDLLFGDDAVEMPLKLKAAELCPALADRAIRQFSFLDFVAEASLPLLEKFADARQVENGELQEAFARVAPARAKTGVMAWLLERFGLDPPPDQISRAIKSADDSAETIDWLFRRFGLLRALEDRRTARLEALLRDNLSAARLEASARGEEPAIRDPEEEIPIERFAKVAARCGRVDILDELIEHFEMRERGIVCRKLLRVAAHSNSANVVRWAAGRCSLAEEARLALYEKTAGEGGTEALAALADVFGLCPESLVAMLAPISTALTVAVANGHKETAEWIIEYYGMTRYPRLSKDILSVARNLEGKKIVAKLREMLRQK